jgi:7-cyano-7-deazaguanine synthase
MTRETAGALVLFSGGQDSAPCLAWALDRFQRVETVGIDSGWRVRPASPPWRGAGEGRRR